MANLGSISVEKYCSFRRIVDHDSMIESKMCVICGHTQPLDMETKIILGTALFSEFGIYIEHRVPVILHNQCQAGTLPSKYFVSPAGALPSKLYILHKIVLLQSGWLTCWHILFALVKIWMSWVARVRVRQTIFRVEIHSPG